jgi:hypothetical protein
MAVVQRRERVDEDEEGVRGRADELAAVPRLGERSDFGDELGVAPQPSNTILIPTGGRPSKARTAPMWAIRFACRLPRHAHRSHRLARSARRAGCSRAARHRRARRRSARRAERSAHPPAPGSHPRRSARCWERQRVDALDTGIPDELGNEIVGVEYRRRRKVEQGDRRDAGSRMRSALSSGISRCTRSRTARVSARSPRCSSSRVLTTCSSLAVGTGRPGGHVVQPAI